MCVSSCWTEPQGATSSSCLSIAVSPRLDAGREQWAAVLSISLQRLQVHSWNDLHQSTETHWFKLFCFPFHFSVGSLECVSVRWCCFRSLFKVKYKKSSQKESTACHMLENPLGFFSLLLFWLSLRFHLSRFFSLLRVKVEMWQKGCNTGTGYRVEKDCDRRRREPNAQANVIMSNKFTLVNLLITKSGTIICWAQRWDAAECWAVVRCERTCGSLKAREEWLVMGTLMRVFLWAFRGRRQ